MNKFILFILGAILGIACEWISFIVYIKFLSYSAFSSIFGLILLPLAIFLFISCYFIVKKKEDILILGLSIGFAIVFLLLILR